MPGADTASRYADRPWLASYPDGVPADYDFPSVPLTRLLDDAAASFPTRAALSFLGARLTYRQLKDAVDRFATGLAGLGVAKGDRVALVLPNCPQNVIAMYAALRLGAVVVQHNPLYTPAELRAQLADCGATVAVCLDRVYHAVAEVRAQTALQHVVVTSLADYLPPRQRLALRLPTPRGRATRSQLAAELPKGAPVTRFASLLKGEPARQAPVDPGGDLALLQYTGGTTGASKGAMLTHRNLVSNAYMNRLWDTGAVAGREVTLAVLPLFHAYGLTVCLNATLLLGGTLVLVPRFEVTHVLATIEREKPTMFPGVPPLYQALVDSPRARAHELGSLRVCVSGAMRLPPETAAAFERLTGGRLVEGYGLTETSPSTHCNPLTGAGRPGSIGLPLPGTECRVLDPDDPASVVPVGQPGELAVRGPQVFRGYWNSDVDGLFTSDGFVRTGDIVVMDDDGSFRVVDRKKELIIAGGFNVYPSEVEQVLAGLPGVAEAVVVGVPDRYRGETVKAYVVAEPGAQVDVALVLEACRSELAAYKVPRTVQVVPDLPRSPVGKVLRRVLVERERELAAAAAQPPPASTPGGRRPTSASGTAASVKKPAPASKPAPARKSAPVEKAAGPAKKSGPASKAAPARKSAPASKAAPATKAAPAKKSGSASKPAPAKKSAPATRPAKAGAAKKAPSVHRTAAVSEPAPVDKPVTARKPVPARNAAPASGTRPSRRPSTPEPVTRTRRTPPPPGG